MAYLPKRKRPLTTERFCKSCCSWILSCILWLLMVLFFVFAVLLLYWGILVGTSNRIIESTMVIIAEKFGDQIEFLMRQVFVALESVIRKMRIQLDVHLHTFDTDVRRIFQNALHNDSALLRNLQAPILASEELVFGLAYFYRPTTGSMSFLARTSSRRNQPMYVLRNQDQELLAEKYFPERVELTEVLFQLPDVRSLFTGFIPRTFPNWMEPITVSEIVPFDMNLNLGSGSYVIGLWDSYNVPRFVTNTSTDPMSTEAGYILSVTPVEAFHQIFRMLSDNLPVTVILVETNTLTIVANSVENLTKKVRVTNYHVRRVANPVLFLKEKYGNLSQVPQGLTQYKDEKRTGSHIFVRRLVKPYQWTLIMVLDQQVLNTWDKVVLIMLGIAAALSLVATIPICLIAQCYVHLRDYLRERYGEHHQEGKIVSAPSSHMTPPSTENSSFPSIYPQ